MSKFSHTEFILRFAAKMGRSITAGEVYLAAKKYNRNPNSVVQTYYKMCREGLLTQKKGTGEVIAAYRLS